MSLEDLVNTGAAQPTMSHEEYIRRSEEERVRVQEQLASSKREQRRFEAAVAVAKGLSRYLAEVPPGWKRSLNEREVAAQAVAMADALLEELERTK